MNLKKRIRQFFILSQFNKLPLPDNKDLGIIIFSKDRPIQLFALLESYFNLCKDQISCPITVIYKCSNQDFKKAYLEIGKIWDNTIFTEEVSFREMLINTVKDMKVSRLLFLVDDIIFTREFKISSFEKYDLKQTVPSLRLGKNIVYSYVRQKAIKQPVFSSDGLHLEWNWIKHNSYWSYPLSLDGHIFDKIEIQFMLSKLDFKAPNSLEEALYFFNNAFFKRKGVSFEKSILVNIPWNLVQTELNNLHESITTDELLKYWNDNKKIKISFFHEIENESCHQNYEIQLITRDVTTSANISL